MKLKDSLAHLFLLLSLVSCQSPLISSVDNSTVGLTAASLVEPIVGTTRSSLSRDVATDSFKVREGGTVRVGGHLWAIQGDYDGTVVLGLDNGDSLIVPEYDQTFSPEIGFGYRGEVYGLEVTYKRFESEGTFGAGAVDDQWNYLDVNFRQFYRTTHRLQPFVSMGLGYFFGTIVDGASSDGINFEDFDFTGVSLNVGGGLALYLTESLAVDVHGIYRYAETLDAESPQAGNVSIIDGLDASGYGVSFGLTYTL